MSSEENSSLAEAIAIAKTKAEKPYKKQSYYLHTSHLNDKQIKALLDAGWWKIPTHYAYLISPRDWTPT